jgi:hypothetical protein
MAAARWLSALKPSDGDIDKLERVKLSKQYRGLPF